MYHLSVYFNDSKSKVYGLGHATRDYYLNSAEDVCEVIKALSPYPCLFTLCEISFSDVQDVVSEVIDLDKTWKNLDKD